MRNLIKVIPFTNFISIKTCELNIRMNLHIQVSGIPADLIIFPYIDTFSNNKIAGVHCATDFYSNRPTAGALSFPSDLKFTKTNYLHYFAMRTLSALTHIMLFNIHYLFPNFVDRIGDKIPINKTIQYVDGIWLVVSPRVVETVRNFVGCNKIKGIRLVQIQDNTDDHSNPNKYPNNIKPLSFWHSRQMLTDYMTLDDNEEEPVISEITLALFEDSGWYYPNYYTGGLFMFGKSQGCGFSNSCISYYKNSNHFCNVPNKTMCNTNRLSKAYCYINTDNKPFPKQGQYFYNNPFWSGQPSTLYCPVAKPITSNDRYYEGSCSKGRSSYYIGMFEHISKYAKCFMSSLFVFDFRKYREFNDEYFPICYEIFCDYDSKSYKIFLDDLNTVYVEKEGGKITKTGMRGNIIAPEFALVCPNKIECNNAIDCALNHGVLGSPKLQNSEFNLQNITPAPKVHFTNKNVTMVEPKEFSTDQAVNVLNYEANIKYNIKGSCGYGKINSFVVVIVCLVLWY